MNRESSGVVLAILYNLHELDYDDLKVQASEGSDPETSACVVSGGCSKVQGASRLDAKAVSSVRGWYVRRWCVTSGGIGTVPRPLFTTN